MSTNKRKDAMNVLDDTKPKRTKMECNHGDKCVRRNPVHFREFSHRHLEEILDNYSGNGDYPIPEKYNILREFLVEQLDIIVEQQLYKPCTVAQVDNMEASSSSRSTNKTESHTNAFRTLTQIKEEVLTIESNDDRKSPLKEKFLKIKNKDFKNDTKPKRVKIQCDYGDKCFRRNPTHFRYCSHAHLENILDNYCGHGVYPIPDKYESEKEIIKEQLDIIVEKQLYKPHTKAQVDSMKASSSSQSTNKTESHKNASSTSTQIKKEENLTIKGNDGRKSLSNNEENKILPKQQNKNEEMIKNRDYKNDANYRPINPPTRRAEDYLNVIRPKGKMAQKHAAAAPYYIFYTTITDAKETHIQPYSITFQEILDLSLGELKCSLQINFMVEIGWLLAQYYFAGYSEKKLTILYGDDCGGGLKNISQQKPQVDAHYVSMKTPFGKHHTKVMLLCYEDGSLRVVVSTANLYLDDWENRTQGLWFSPKCPELPPDAMPYDGESPTMFKRSLLRYLNHYHLPALTYYVDRVKRCDFSHINVFFVASVPGSHFDKEWGMTRMGSLLRQHCDIPTSENKNWPLLAQASSIGSYGQQPKLWLKGDLLSNFTKIKSEPGMLQPLPEIKIIYPSLENVRNSHDGLLGGGCLPYSASVHTKQPWLNDYLYQWKALSTNRNRAMPHLKSYLRISPDNKQAAFYLLTSANVSKAAWGSITKGTAALRIMSYEAGVLFLPRYVINEDFFPLEDGSKNKLPLAYDVPPVKYTQDMSPWVSDYLM